MNDNKNLLLFLLLIYMKTDAIICHCANSETIFVWKNIITNGAMAQFYILFY